MEAEKVLSSYDCLWFRRHIFEKEPTFSFSSISETNPDGEIGVKASEDQLSLSSMSGSVSPNSVLSTSKLRSLFSETDLETPKKTTPFKELALKNTRRKRVSELELEEVKGFRDLGFVFAEEDRNSSLGSVILGLNKLGLEDEEEKKDLDESKISRPYLSEGWEVLDLDRRRENITPLLKNWKLPSMNSETDMKANLRWWAHAVASTVR